MARNNVRIGIDVDGSRFHRCAAQHFGPWIIEAAWFAQAVDAVREGTFQPYARAIDVNVDAAANEPSDGPSFSVTSDGIALIEIVGQITKGDSSFGGASSVALRRSIRAAAADESVRGILLLVDSPGGTVAGTEELATEVLKARGSKPVWAVGEDLVASAAYWVASQSERISANPTAQIGSIGTIAVLTDSSGRATANGLVVHVISTGPLKGVGVPGAPVTDDHLAYLRARVEGMNEFFLAAVERGRRVPRATVESWADGSLVLAASAKALGMIDAVETLEETVAAFRAHLEAAAPRESTSRRSALARARMRT